MGGGANGLATLGVLLRAALFIYIAGSLASLLLQLAFVATGEFSPSGVMMALAAVGAIGGLAAGASVLACVLLVPMWTYRAQANLHQAQLSGLRFGPAWAAAAWFVPFANLVVPFWVMRQLYNRSEGESEFQEADGAGDVTAWWALTIAALVVLSATLAIALIEMVPGLFVTMPPIGAIGLAVINTVLQVGAGIYLLRLVGRITRAQIAGLHLSSAAVFA